MARVYADVNERMPRSYWDYDSVNISWGVLENYEVVRKIGKLFVLCALLRIEEWLECGISLTCNAKPMLMASIDRSGKIFRSVRGHQCRQLPEVCY